MGPELTLGRTHLLPGPGLTTGTSDATLLFLDGGGFVVIQPALQGHFIAHVTQIEIQAPGHLVVLKGFAGRLQGGKALTDHARGGALFPLEGLFEAQA
jgi:hypothetical protein